MGGYSLGYVVTALFSRNLELVSSSSEIADLRSTNAVACAATRMLGFRLDLE